MLEAGKNRLENNLKPAHGFFCLFVSDKVSLNTHLWFLIQSRPQSEGEEGAERKKVWRGRRRDGKEERKMEEKPEEWETLKEKLKKICPLLVEDRGSLKLWFGRVAG